jgi:hypothetical protein
MAEVLLNRIPVQYDPVPTTVVFVSARTQSDPPAAPVIAKLPGEVNATSTNRIGCSIVPPAGLTFVKKVLNAPNCVTKKGDSPLLLEEESPG